MRALALALALTAAGCSFYGGGGDDVCPATGTPLLQPAPLRNPADGTCESFGGGCRGIPYPDWAVCGGACEGKGEADCRDTAGCRPIYTGRVCPPDAACAFSTQITFLACWGTAPSGPLEGGDCWGLDPLQCSQHDDCAGVFRDATTPMAWVSCMPEPRPLDPGACVGVVTCRAQPPACPAGTVAGVAGLCYSGYCIPQGECDGARDPGTCGGALCALSSPVCPAGTVAGARDGCWSGYCIPIAACSQ